MPSGLLLGCHEDGCDNFIRQKTHLDVRYMGSNKDANTYVLLAIDTAGSRQTYYGTSVISCYKSIRIADCFQRHL